MTKKRTAFQVRKSISDNFARDLYLEKKIKNMAKKDQYDQKIFDRGIEWYNSGLEIVDAPEDIRNNTNFVNGFNKAKRLAEMNNLLYENGKNFFYSGCSLEQASENMKTNPYFIKGYQDALSFEDLLKRSSR